MFWVEFLVGDVGNKVGGWGDFDVVVGIDFLLVNF